MTLITPINRRRLLRNSLASGAALTALGFPAIGRAQAKGSVTFFSYTTYSDAKLTGEFSKQTGIELKVQNFGDIDQMVARLKAGGGQGLDVVSVPNNLTEQLYKDGLLEPIDTARIGAWSDLYPEFRNADFIATERNGFVSGVPTVWGPEGLIYRTDKIPQANSWNLLWDNNFKGRISAPDYSYEMVLIAAQVLGYQNELTKPTIDFTDAQFAAIKAKLIEQKKVVTKYWTSSAEATTLIGGGEVWASVGRISMIKPLAEEKVPVRLIAPKEGAQGWCTMTCVVKGTPNKDAAYAFLNFAVGQTYQDALVTVRGYPLSNKKIMSSYPEATRNQLMLNDPDLLTSLVWWRPVKDLQRITALWNEVKAS
jgi:spermidine/putrescine-binding protein